MNMRRLHLLALLGLVMADTDPRDFSRLCDRDARCPENWKLIDGNCIMFAGLDEARVRELCKQNQAEYLDFLFESILPLTPGVPRTQNSLPVCLVRRETQCNCGRTFRSDPGKIVGGGNVEKNEYPWQVRLSLPGCPACCGGTVLSRDTILTAAHCTEDRSASNITVWTRDHDWTKQDGEMRHAVCSKKEHHSYNRANKDNDIAILKLCQPLMFTEVLQPICLADPTQDYDNVTAVVTGWGTLKYGDFQPDILQEVTVRTQSTDSCRGKYERIGYEISENMICAAEPGKDSCKGDSGGPLAVLGQDNSYRQIGVVSFGRGCARPDFPGVYTRVTSLLGWIQDRIQEAFTPLQDYPASITVNSTGPAAEKQGSKMGRYDLDPSLTAQLRPVYRKTDNKHAYIYYRPGGHWFISGISPSVNSTSGWIRSEKTGLLTIPTSGWQYYDWDSDKWNGDDDTLQFIYN